MKALVFEAVDHPIQVAEVSAPECSEDQVLVDVLAAALNHRDVWITKGLYPGLQSGVVLGSDACVHYEGKEYLINPNVDWGDDPRFGGKSYSILGMPTHGAFCEKLAIAVDRLVPKPEHLSAVQAAAMPLGGLTAFRALMKKGKCTSNDRVCINGIGGGVALIAMQFALTAGAEIWVTSSSHEKIEKAMDLGASGGQNYREDGWHKALQAQSGGFDIIIDSAGGPGFNNLLKIANPGGRIVTYGGSAGAIEKLSPQILFWKQLEIHGTTMGNDQEFLEMVDFVDQHKIVPVLDRIYSLEEGPQAFARMDQGSQFGKIVFEIQK